MKILIYISLLLVTANSFSQQLSTSLSKSKISIGEPFELKFRIESTDSLNNIVYMPPQEELVGFIIPDSVEATVPKPYNFEIYSEFDDTLLYEENKFIWEATFTLTGWDSASVMITQERIVISDSTYVFPTEFIEILSPIASANKAVYDIEESLADIPADLSPFMKFLKTHWWWLIIVVLGIIALIIVILKRRKVHAIIGDAPETLKDRVIEEIDKLEASKLYESDLKEYYFKLSIILRKFFSNNFNEPFMDKTTVQIREVLRTKNLAPDTIQTIITLLQSSDLVKFAKSIPGDEEIKAVTHKARQVVAEVAKIQIIVPKL